MIPQRMLSNEISGSGLRNRVTACRKRLRENRVMLKAHANIGVVELFPEAAPSLIRLHDHAADNSPDCSAKPTSPVQTDPLCFEYGEQIEEQEAGIT